MNFYKRFIGDYARDTAHLSLMEHGAYTMLLDTCYATERPLPADLGALCRICRAVTAAERAAVRRVVDEFFPMGKDGERRNNRASRELASASAYADAQSMRAHKRWHKPEVMQRQSPDDASHSHSQKEPKSKALFAGANGAWEKFWNSYPKKTSKQDALKAWGRVRADDVPVVMAALELHKATEQWQRGVIPHPATWLNKRRWEDEAATAKESSDSTCCEIVDGHRCGKPGVFGHGRKWFCREHEA